ncbi:MAG: family 10 glycosylhydrolase [Phycisphaerales bacterium]
MNERPLPTPTSPTGADAPQFGRVTTHTIGRREAIGRAIGLGAAAACAPVLLACQTTTRPRASHASGRWRQDALLRPPTPPREFRAVWVASVANIDWPATPTADAASLREQAGRIVARCKAIGLNTIILQVRPSCDAIYESRLEPWSEFLTGRAGRGPTPGYDPLEHWITLAHNAGMELHAWFNPFRARHHRATGPDDARHVVNTRPGLVRTYSNLKWLDPGEPESRQHSLDVITDVIRRYDIDGVHLDDYFYPYPVAGRPFPDDTPFARFGAGLSRGDWRRRNINEFVQRLGREIKAIKPGLPFGISPFGIWRPGHPAGVVGFDAYEELAADARLWLREGWLDYVAPQLYWKTDAPQQPYEHLLRWWRAQNTQGRHVWPGLYASRVADAEQRWPKEEILRQIEIARSVERVAPGVALYSAATLMSDAGGLATALQRSPFAEAALPPRYAWLPGAPAPAAPSVTVQDGGALSFFNWQAYGEARGIRGWAVWTRAESGSWTLRVKGASERSLEVRSRGDGAIDAVAVAAIGPGSVVGEAWSMRRHDR